MGGVASVQAEFVSPGEDVASAELAGAGGDRGKYGAYNSGAGLGLCRFMTPGFFRPVSNRAMNVNAHSAASDMMMAGGSSSSSMSTMTHPKNRPMGRSTRSCVRTKLFQSGPAQSTRVRTCLQRRTHQVAQGRSDHAHICSSFKQTSYRQ